MKRWLLLIWLLAPLPVLVWHFGPGQKWLARDRAHALINEGRRAEARGDWALAESRYREAAGKIGGADPDIRMQLDIALVRTRYQQGGALEAIDGIDRVLADARFRSLPEGQQHEARELAGRLHYYAAWVMRLEGAQKDLWMEEAELARQNYRLLTESSFDAGNTGYAQTQQTNLESSVRLQRMSYSELMGRALPEEGQKMASQGLSEQMAKRRGERGKGQAPGEGQNEEGPPAKGAGTTRFPGGPGS
jgi:hypothetical protein